MERDADANLGVGAENRTRSRDLRYELIIFDCDGVLVDTEPISNQVLCEMLNGIGLPFTYEETVETFIGRSDAATKSIIEGRLG